MVIIIMGGRGRTKKEDESPCRGFGWVDKCLSNRGFQKDSLVRLLAAKTSGTRGNKPKCYLLGRDNSRVRNSCEKAQEQEQMGTLQGLVEACVVEQEKHGNTQ